MKDALRGPRKKELSYMVDEMVKHIRKLDIIDEALETLLAEPGDCVTISRAPSGERYTVSQDSEMTGEGYHHDDLAEVLRISAKYRRLADADSGRNE